MELNFNYWFLQTIAMLITVWLLPGLRVTNIIGALGMVIGLGFVNSFLWDAALFFSVPEELSVHTLLLLSANGVIFWVLVKLLPGIEIEGVMSAIAAPIVFTVTSALIYAYAKDVDWVAVFSRFADGIRYVRDYLAQGAPPREAAPPPMLPAVRP